MVDKIIFPHHENEIAQSEAASGKEFAITGFTTHLDSGNEKMSKSLGIFFQFANSTPRSALKF